MAEEPPADLFAPGTPAVTVPTWGRAKCPDCEVPGFMGYGGDPKVRWCAAHMPELEAAEREAYRKLLKREEVTG